MIFILDIVLNPTRKVIYKAEGRDGGGAVGVGSPITLAFGSDLCAGLSAGGRMVE